MLINCLPESLSDRDALSYMFENRLPFLQSRVQWTHCEKKNDKWVFMLCPMTLWGDVVYDIIVSAPSLKSIKLACDAGETLFLWQREQSTETDVSSVKLNVSVCLIKFGMVFAHLVIDSVEMPNVSAVHVMYNDDSARQYEAQHNVMQGYSAMSDLWDPDTQSLRSVPTNSLQQSDKN